MRLTTLLPLAATLFLGAAIPAQAGQNTSITVSGAWIRVLPGSLPNAGYAVLHNDSDHAVELVSADSPAYGHVMLHKSTEAGGVSRMVAVKTLAIPAHGEVTLAPGGYHLMMMHAVQPVKPGVKVSVHLHFADGSTLDSRFLARPANASGVND